MSYGQILIDKIIFGNYLNDKKMVSKSFRQLNAWLTAGFPAPTVPSNLHSPLDRMIHSSDGRYVLKRSLERLGLYDFEKFDGRGEVLSHFELLEDQTA